VGTPEQLISSQSFRAADQQWNMGLPGDSMSDEVAALWEHGCCSSWHELPTTVGLFPTALTTPM
jgi:hypothetical protein